MQTQHARAPFAVALLCLSSACAADAIAPSPASLPSTRSLSYEYSGSAGYGRVTREQAADGMETLSGTLELASSARPTPHTRSTERVSLDPRGQLSRADIVIERPGAVDLHYTLDPGQGSVHIARAERSADEWSVPSDAPWVYAPATLGDGALVVTPVSSWVALRAADSALVVRVLEPERRATYLVPIDQLVVPTEQGTTVTFGYDAVAADDRFVTDLRLSGGELTLRRSEANVPRPARDDG